MTSVQLTYIPRDKKYQQLKNLLSRNWAMLLDSGVKNKQTGQKADSYRRYDICVCDPSVQLTLDDDALIISREQQEEKISNQNAQDTLLVMRKLLAKYAPPLTFTDDEKQQLPFNGGWLGYFSYDFGRKLRQNSLKTADIQNASEDLNMPLIRMGLYQWAIISDHQNKTSFLYNFGLSHQRWEELKHDIIPALNETNKTATARTSTTSFYLTRPFKSNLSYSDYAEAFQKIQGYIYAGDCYQVNFAQRFSTEFNGNTFGIYTILAEENDSPFSAYLNFPDQSIMSFSPERFIESHQGKVLTQPIKGTLPRDTDPDKDKELAIQLLNSEKDKAENLMIVDLLRNDLSKTAEKGSVKVTELFGLYQFASVHHLISTVTSTLDKKFDNFDLLATTLPGGSITGAPKIRAMQIIDELEPVKRGIYCGIIGYIDFNGNMDTNICIRTLVADKNNLYCWAGGGLVTDSKLELEYQETFDKLNKILPVLNNLIDNPTQVIG